MSLEIVVERVGIHGEHPFSQIGFVFVGQLNELDPTLEIFLKCGEIFCCVVMSKALTAFEQIGCDVVVRIDFVAGMDVAVDACCYGFEEFFSREVLVVV